MILEHSVWDYLVFFIFLIASTAYPLWSESRAKKKQIETKANYVFASQVSMILMMLSIARGTLGVKSVLGYPSELMYRGSGMWETLYGLISAYPIVCFALVPVYLNLNITSVYQYLDLRFKSPLIRRLASGSYALKNVLQLAITIYTPCLALYTIIGLPTWISLSAMTLIGIAFTVFGNLKAAIIADVIQTVTMILVSVAIIIYSSIVVNDGVKEIYETSRDNGRLEFFKFTGDITTRIDTLSAWLGNIIISVNTLGCSQNMVQRYVSMKTVKNVTKALMFNIPIITILFSLTWIVGMCIYTIYLYCDPFKAGYIDKIDEILPYFIVDQLTIIPGFLGIFLASLFNGALCIIASNYNSLATITWEDFILPFFQSRIEPISDRKQLLSIKSLGVVYAIITMLLAYGVGFFSGIIEISMLINSATCGPLVGVYLLAMFVPFANSKGASTGIIVSYLLTIAIIIGSFTVQNLDTEFLTTSIEKCDNNTRNLLITNSSRFIFEISTEIIMETKQIVEPQWNFLENIFRMSYMYYGVLGTLVTILVGIIVSLLTRTCDNHIYDVKLIHPLINRILKYDKNT